MAYWLMKSEPGTWSWQDQVNKGEEGEGWDGVRNYQASNNMKAMNLGDLAFFYHSVSEKSIVGILEIIEKYHPDPTDSKGRFGMVTVKALKSVNNPVYLSDIKENPDLKDIALIRQSRLSVLPLSLKHWKIILQMSNTEL